MQFSLHSGRIFLVKTSPELATLKAAYTRPFCHRIFVARDGAGFTPVEMANELGVKPNTYTTYERFVVMPHFLLPKFIVLTEVSADYVLGLSKYKRKPRLKAIK